MIPASVPMAWLGSRLHLDGHTYSVVLGVALLAAGWLLNWGGICSIVKRIWTPSWALFSTGWCCLCLALLYGAIDGLRLRILALPVIVVGMNSIAMYCMGQLLKPWTSESLQRHLGSEIYLLAGELYQPVSHQEE